jgi:hypothetical protein
MEKRRVYNQYRKNIFIILLMFFMLFLHYISFSDITVIQGEKGSGYYIPGGGEFSFNKIKPEARCGVTQFTIVNNGESLVEFTGEKITLVNADDTDVLDFTLDTGDLTDYIQPGGGDTSFTLQFTSPVTDGKLKRALVVLSFAGEDQHFEFYVSSIAKTKVMYEFTAVGNHYWQSPGNGIADITLVGAGGGGGGGAGCFSLEEDGCGGYGGRAGQIINTQIICSLNTIYRIVPGNGGSGGSAGKGCNHAVEDHPGGHGSSGSPSIIYLNNERILLANGGAGNQGGNGPGDRHGTPGQNGYNNSPGGAPGPTNLSESGEPGRPGAATAGGGGGSGGDQSDSPTCKPDGGRGGNGGTGYCKIEWIGFLE